MTDNFPLIPFVQSEYITATNPSGSGMQRASRNSVARLRAEIEEFRARERTALRIEAVSFFEEFMNRYRRQLDGMDEWYYVRLAEIIEDLPPDYQITAREILVARSPKTRYQQERYYIRKISSGRMV